MNARYAAEGLRRLDGLGGLAKLDFGAEDTPLQFKPALGAALGLRTPLLVKRDDRAGPGMGGNKTRKLQYVIADALDRGADCLITAGAVQSNHADLTAVCGGMAALEVHLVLGGDPDEMRGGNLVIEQLVAAQPHFVAADEWELLVTESERIHTALRAEGLLLDPVYTSKAVAAVPAMVADGLVGPAETVVFLHTGGLAALFAPIYAEALR